MFYFLLFAIRYIEYPPSNVDASITKAPRITLKVSEAPNKCAESVINRKTTTIIASIPKREMKVFKGSMIFCF